MEFKVTFKVVGFKTGHIEGNFWAKGYFRKDDEIIELSCTSVYPKIKDRIDEELSVVIALRGKGKASIIDVLN